MLHNCWDNSRYMSYWEPMAAELLSLKKLRRELVKAIKINNTRSITVLKEELNKRKKVCNVG